MSVIPFENLLSSGLQIINKFIPDEQQKAKAEAELRASLLAWDAGQNAVNAAEAGNNNLFVAGWRPAVGWVCAAALFYTYMLVPIGMWVGFVVGHPIPKPPALDGNLWELMFGMLGLGGLRSFEKIKGVAK